MIRSHLIPAFMILFQCGLSDLSAQANLPNRKTQKEQLKAVARLVDQRLSYMKDVAAYKWSNRLNIEDRAREAIVLQSSQENAQKYGLDTLTTRHFFEQQIKAAKTIQKYWFDQWNQGGFPADPFRDLKEVIRPALLALGEEILVAAAEIETGASTPKSGHRWRRKFIRQIQTIGLSVENKEELYLSFRKIR